MTVSRLNRLGILPVPLGLPAPRRRRFADGMEGFHPLRQFRVWQLGKRSALEAGRTPPVVLVMSYRTLQAAEEIATNMTRAIPTDVFDVEDAGTDVLQAINFYTGEIRDVTAAEWQSQWPREPLPEKAPRRRGRPSLKGAVLEQAA